MWPIVQNRFGAGQWIFYNVGNCFRVDNNSVVLHNLRDYCQPCKVMYMWRGELEEIYLCSFFQNSCLLSFKNIAVITNWQTARCTSSRPTGRLILLPVPDVEKDPHFCRPLVPMIISDDPWVFLKHQVSLNSTHPHLHIADMPLSGTCNVARTLFRLYINNKFHFIHGIIRAWKWSMTFSAGLFCGQAKQSNNRWNITVSNQQCKLLKYKKSCTQPPAGWLKSCQKISDFKYFPWWAWTLHTHAVCRGLCGLQCGH